VVARRPPPARGPILAGLLLILAGIGLLVVQQTGFRFDWPIWIVVGGIATLGMAIVLGYSGPGADAAGTGIAVVGGIITAVGGVLAVQDATGAYASWAYGWALVAPGGVGLGLLVYGLAVGNGETARGGLGTLATGLVLFTVFFIFFEGVLDLTTLGDDWLTGSIGPLILVGLGVLFVLAAMLPRGWRGGGATAPVGGSTTGARQGDLETIEVELAGAPAGDVAIAFGAGRLAIGGPAAAGRLVDGSCFGGVRREDLGLGRVRLSTPSDAFWQKAWGQAPFDWRLGLSAEVPLRLAIEVGAAQTDADLSALRVTELRLRTGAAETSMVLPAAAGFTRVDAEGGAASVRFRVPDGVAARIRSTMAIGTTDVDTARFPRDPLGGWASPDFATATNRVEIEVRGGLGTVSVH